MANRKTIKAERDLQNKLAPLLDGVRKKIERKIKEENRPLSESELDMIINAIVNPDFMTLYNDIMISEAIKISQYGMDKVTYELRQRGNKAKYGILDSNTKRLIEESVFEASARTMSKIRGDIKQPLLEGYTEGLGTREIAKNLSFSFDQMKQSGLARIARTEINSFQNQSNFIAKQNAGIKYHEWVSSEDERVRDSHRGIHGQIVRVGDEFSNGLKYPGDRNGPLKEWINCRCITRAFFVPEGYIIPIGKNIFKKKDLIKINKN